MSQNKYKSQVAAICRGCQAWCDEHDKSTEFMISYMADHLRIQIPQLTYEDSHDLVMEYLMTPDSSEPIVPAEERKVPMLHGYAVVYRGQYFLDKNMNQYGVPVDGKSLVSGKEWAAENILTPARISYEPELLELVEVHIGAVLTSVEQPEPEKPKRKVKGRMVKQSELSIQFDRIGRAMDEPYYAYVRNPKKKPIGDNLVSIVVVDKHGFVYEKMQGNEWKSAGASGNRMFQSEKAAGKMLEIILGV